MKMRDEDGLFARNTTNSHVQEIQYICWIIQLSVDSQSTNADSWELQIQEVDAGMQHECVHLHEITEAAGTEDAEYDNALKETIRGVQEAVTYINEYLEDIRYEIEALEAD